MCLGQKAGRRPPKIPNGTCKFTPWVLWVIFKPDSPLVYIEYKNAKSSPNGWGIQGADDLWTHTPPPPPIMRCLNYDIAVMDDFCTKVSPYVTSEKSNKTSLTPPPPLGRKQSVDPPPIFSKITAMDRYFTPSMLWMIFKVDNLWYVQNTRNQGFKRNEIKRIV